VTSFRLSAAAAPDGHHVLHAYLPATEPYERWRGLERNSDEYKQLKEERARPLWEAVERFIPDIRERAVVSCVPLSRRHSSHPRAIPYDARPCRHTAAPPCRPYGSHARAPRMAHTTSAP
jgi:hypothetical protein